MNPFLFKGYAEYEGLTIVGEKGLTFAWKIVVSDGRNTCAVTFHLDGRTRIEGSEASLNRRISKILEGMG